VYLLLFPVMTAARELVVSVQYMLDMFGRHVPRWIKCSLLAFLQIAHHAQVIPVVSGSLPAQMSDPKALRVLQVVELPMRWPEGIVTIRASAITLEYLSKGAGILRLSRMPTTTRGGALVAFVLVLCLCLCLFLGVFLDPV
jgi:hypothetical protein